MPKSNYKFQFLITWRIWIFMKLIFIKNAKNYKIFFLICCYLAKNVSIFYAFLENLTTDITIGQVDPREVISLFPRMLPSSSNFTRAIPSLHDIADINQVISICFCFFIKTIWLVKKIGIRDWFFVETWWAAILFWKS